MAPRAGGRQPSEGFPVQNPECLEKKKRKKNRTALGKIDCGGLLRSAVLSIGSNRPLFVYREREIDGIAYLVGIRRRVHI